jgi:hypothetical protein
MEMIYRTLLPILPAQLNTTHTGKCRETQDFIPEDSPCHCYTILNRDRKQERNFKADNEQRYAQRNKDRHDSRFLTRNNASKKTTEQHFKCIERTKRNLKNFKPVIHNPKETVFKCEGKTKTF